MVAATRHVLVLAGDLRKFCLGQPFTPEDYERCSVESTDPYTLSDGTRGHKTDFDGAFNCYGLETLPVDNVSAAVQVIYDCAKSVNEALLLGGKAQVDAVHCNLRNVAERLVVYCALAGVSELHTNALRDPWNAALDATVAAALRAKGIRLVLHDGAYLIPAVAPTAKSSVALSSPLDHLRSFDAFARWMEVPAAASSHWPSSADLSMPFFATALPMLQHVMVDPRAQEVATILQSACHRAYGPESSELSWLGAPASGIVIGVALGSLRQYVKTVARSWSYKDHYISSYAMMSCFPPVLQALTIAGYISARDLWGAVSALARVCSHAIDTCEVDTSCASSGPSRGSVARSEGSTQLNSTNEAHSLTSDPEVGCHVHPSEKQPAALSISSVTAVASSFVSGQLFAAWGIGVTSSSSLLSKPAQASDDFLDELVGSLSKEMDAHGASSPNQMPSLRSISFVEVIGADGPKLQTRSAIRDILLFLSEFSERMLRWLTLREYCSHLVKARPEIAVCPGRAELSLLPWANNAAMPISMPDGTIQFSSFASDRLDAQLRRQLEQQYADVSVESVSAFTSGCTGYTLVDASMRCLRSKGFLPKPLYALLHNYWTKCLGQPWTSGMSLLSGICIDSDPCLATMQWQWNVGFVAGCKWAYPVDTPDVLCGHLPVPLMAKIVPQAADEAHVASRYPWDSWTRQNPFLPSHPHCMAHPAANEFAYKQDPYGVFVRRWLEDAELSSSFPDAFVYHPSSAPAHVVKSCNQTSKTSGTPMSPGHARGSYYFPSVSLARSRQRSLDCVLMVMRHWTMAAHVAGTADISLSKQLLKEYQSVTSPTKPSDSRLMASDPVLSFLQNQAASGYDPLWGTINAWPVVVEEDAEILTEQQTARKDDGWAEIVDDPERFLKVYMQHRADSAVKTVLASSELRGHTCSEAFEAIDVLTKYKKWDKTWQRVNVIGESVDLFTTIFYFLADAPPPPYSYLITQRDFVMFRYSFRNPFTGAGINVLRNGSHASVPAATTFIRGETLGCVGFMVSPLLLPWRASSVKGKTAFTEWAAGTADTEPIGARVVLMTAADPKGSIPAYLINFVAKRTPKMWVDRLSEACVKFAAEEA